MSLKKKKKKKDWTNKDPIVNKLRPPFDFTLIRQISPIYKNAYTGVEQMQYQF